MISSFPLSFLLNLPSSLIIINISPIFPSFHPAHHSLLPFNLWTHQFWRQCFWKGIQPYQEIRRGIIGFYFGKKFCFLTFCLFWFRYRFRWGFWYFLFQGWRMVEEKTNGLTKFSFSHSDSKWKIVYFSSSAICCFFIHFWILLS